MNEMLRDTGQRRVMVPLRLKALHEKLWDLLDQHDAGRTSAAESAFIERVHARRSQVPVLNEYRFSDAETREIAELHRKLCR